MRSAEAPFLVCSRPRTLLLVLEQVTAHSPAFRPPSASYLCTSESADNLLVFNHNSLDGLAPLYLSDLLLSDAPLRSLRSANQLLPVVLETKTEALRGIGLSQLRLPNFGTSCSLASDTVAPVAFYCLFIAFFIHVFNLSKVWSTVSFFSKPFMNSFRSN